MVWIEFGALVMSMEGSKILDEGKIFQAPFGREDF